MRLCTTPCPGIVDNPQLRLLQHLSNASCGIDMNDFGVFLHSKLAWLGLAYLAIPPAATTLSLL
jgi:hypothetical protein